MDWFLDWFFTLLYFFQRCICQLIDFIRSIFFMLAGLTPVHIGGESTDLLSYFLLSKNIRLAFLGVFLIGITLLFVFTIVAIIKSEVTEGQGKRTKGQIMAKGLTSFVTFLIIPFLLTAGIMLVNAVMGGISGAMNGSMIDGTTNSTLGGQVLVTSGYDAFIGDGALRSEIERKFITGELSYMDMSEVKQYYELSQMNFFVGIFSSLVMLLMFCLSAITFIQRIFDVILLYIISPVSVSTIPSDDGARFKIWREMLISKVLSAYGIILSMNLFFLIIPQLNAVSFFDNNFYNGIVKLLFIIGGAFAMMKVNMVIAQLTGGNAGGHETQQMMQTIHSGMYLSKAISGGTSKALGAVVGGSEFLKNQKKGAGFLENIKMTAKGNKNRRQVSGAKQKRSGVQKALGFTRLATVPVGILKDAIQGGAVTAGKNLVPRIKNAINGRGIVSHADQFPKLKKNAIASDSETSKDSGIIKPLVNINENIEGEKNENNT